MRTDVLHLLLWSSQYTSFSLMHLRHLERRRRLPKGLRSTLPKVTLVPLVVVVDKGLL